MIFPDTYYPYPMGLPNFCYHLAIKEMAINGKIRLVSLVVYNYILPRKTGKCNNLPRCGVSSDLTVTRKTKRNAAKVNATLRFILQILFKTVAVTFARRRF